MNVTITIDGKSVDVPVEAFGRIVRAAEHNLRMIMMAEGVTPRADRQANAQAIHLLFTFPVLR